MDSDRRRGAPEAAEVFDDAELTLNRIDAQVKLSTLKFIAKCAKTLELNSYAHATAARLFHEFFLATRHSKDYDPHLVAMACIQLAAKAEEQSNVRTRDVINVAHRIAFSTSAPLEYGSEVERIRDSLGRCELLICRALKFHVRYTHPYVYLSHYLANVFDWSNESDAAKRCTTDVAFGVTNDSFLTEVCLTESAPRIAIAAMHCAFALTNFRFPGSDANWWAFFEPTLAAPDLHELASRILEVYVEEAASAGAHDHSDSETETETRMLKWLVDSESGDEEGEKAKTEDCGEPLSQHADTERLASGCLPNVEREDAADADKETVQLSSTASPTPTASDNKPNTEIQHDDNAEKLVSAMEKHVD